MRPTAKSKRPPQRKNNPVSSGILSWTSTLPSPFLEQIGQSPDDIGRALVADGPKRWVVYEPMVLLPSNSFATGIWKTIGLLDKPMVEALWIRILTEISQGSRQPLTHLAVNEGIPLQIAKTESEPEGTAADPRRSHGEGLCPAAPLLARENVIRRPTRLCMLYGDFGPDTPIARGSRDAVAEEDFEAAFWVSTKQNGIRQIWAPRWTMFSRGNVKEKARLLAFHNAPPPTPTGDREEGHLSRRVRPRTSLRDKWAVDLYAGIGYFVFSYARLGLGVLCWELNPWSVEGLRRGADANGWPVRVVKGADLALPTAELVTGRERIVVFLEDNQHARRRIEELRIASTVEMDVVHVNCGLLPSSAQTWEPAWSIIVGAGDGWLHLHENVGAADIQRRRQEIQEVFDTWARLGGQNRIASVEHVEQVKTFAPDVWHCVFDVYTTISSRSY
ncbi:tRNA wybutosine-synthesizing protein 2 [Phialemonium atrogriseum]|uniref:tRNA wybutosine-synthesizing protein 2 n=1 Tax=Phialemonium atrogriseum TaxID=1093897 RepID=A0AAJ0CCC8_9PEZI|nr:tRNA wybutosine-synthesizing protein 2 [Phialemonium atrogriseum]KAK1772687.1 tRNA wybutosine-synthesizing protein 2 [Phialemonium atrogriseum]